MNSNYKILVADDHKMLRHGLILMLKTQLHQDYTFIEATNGEQAIQICKDQNIDLAILDINMPIINGIEATESILKKNISQKILILSMREDYYTVKKLIDLGVKGYITKTIGPEELSKAIQTILNNGIYYDNNISQALINQNNSETDIKQLSDREIEVLKLVANGFSAQEIAKQLYLSKRTIEGHKNRIMTKLNVKNIAGLVKYAILNKID